MYWPDSLTRRRLAFARRRADSLEAGLRGVVRVPHAALQTGEAPLVVHVEEAEHAHGRLAACQLDRLAVELRLGRGRDAGHDLSPGVERQLVLRNRRLDAVLAVHDRHVRAGLRRAVEGGA